MPEKTYDVKYYEGALGQRYKYYEEFQTADKPVKVIFDRETGIAHGVPEQIAVRLHKSEAFDIIGKDGKVPAEFAANASPLGKAKAGYSPAAPPPTYSYPKEKGPEAPPIASRGAKAKA